MKTMFSVMAIVVLACGVAAADNVLINYPDFSSTAGLGLQGAASRVGNVLRVSGTSGANGDAGSAWYTTQQQVAGGFSTTFHFQITSLQGINDDDGNNGGDGFAFVIQNSSVTALGGIGGGIGYDGMSNSVAVEFDTFRNAGFGDPNGNHISIHTGGTAANSDNENHSLGIATNLPYMSDGNIHTAGILYLPGTMTVSLDGSDVLSVPLNLSTKLNLNSGNAWVGFTAAFLAASENHDILNWSVSAVPEPSSLMLAAAGVLSLVAYKYRRKGATTQFRALKPSLSVVVAALSLSGTIAHATTLTWGVNGVGGSGNWDTSTANWFDGSQNVTWPSGGDAVFAGASGGAVNSFTFGPVVSSITFNTAGYAIQNGWVEGGVSGLTVNTNVDATLSSTLANSAFNANVLTKNGPAALIINGTNFLNLLQINQGEVRVVGSSGFFFNNVNFANVPSATATLAQSSTSTQMASLSGGGTLGGVVHPNNQLRTVTLTVLGGGNYGGTLEDNGGGILAFDVSVGGGTQTLTAANPYSGSTRIDSGTLALSGNGSIANSPSLTMTGSLVLDNSAVAVANRIADSAPVSMTSSLIQLKGNSVTPVEEVAGALSFTGVCNISVLQPGSAATQLTFAGLARNDHAVLNVTGPGVRFVGLANSSTGIVPPYITAGNEWATVGGDGRIAQLASSTSDINAGSTNDHVKFTNPTTFTLASSTTRSSLNFQNADTLVPQILDLSGQSLALSTGGILSSGIAPSAIQNGTLSTASGEFVITANNNLIVSAAIANGFGGTALTKSGTGILTLSAANSYTGPTSILQGTIVAASDASLGLGSTIELSGGTLKAGGSFSSSKGFTRNSAVIGAIDTAGFNLSFSGANSAGFTKKGLGALTMTGGAVGSITQTEGSLILSNTTTGAITLQGGTLQANGILASLSVSSSTSVTPLLDIGGPGAGSLTLNAFQWNGSGNMRVNFGLGSGSIDSWAITGSNNSLPTNPASLLFEFSNLGGATTGVDYPLMSFTGVSAPSTNVFALAPDMAAQGWAGSFKVSAGTVSVRFTAVPEPSAIVLMALSLGVAGFIGRSRKTRAAGECGEIAAGNA